MSFSTSTFERPPTAALRTYFLAAALAMSALFAVTAALNWWVDPFNQLGRNWIGVHGLSEREAKPVMIAARSDWRGLILGSSKTTYIDPAALACPDVFNASFPGAVPEEMLEFVRVHAGRPRFVLLGLDFYMVNESAAPWQPNGLPEDDSAAAVTQYLLGGRVVLASLRDLWSHLQGQPPRLTPAGSRRAQGQLARHDGMTGPAYETTLKLLRARHFAAVDYSDRRLTVLERLRELLERRGIDHVVFINPLNQAVLDLLESLPAHADFLRFREDVRRLFPDVVDLSESAWSAPENYFRFDPYHYLPAVGAEFVNRSLLPKLADACNAPAASSSPGRAQAPPNEPSQPADS